MFDLRIVVFATGGRRVPFPASLKLAAELSDIVLWSEPSTLNGAVACKGASMD